MDKEEIYYKNIKLLLKYFPNEMFSKTRLLSAATGGYASPEKIDIVINKLLDEKYIRQVTSTTRTYYMKNE